VKKKQSSSESKQQPQIKTKTYDLDFPLPKHLLPLKLKPFDPGLPYEVNKDADQRVLFILDNISDEEMKSGTVMTGVHGDLLHNLVSKARSSFLHPKYNRKFSWSVINFTNSKIPSKESRKELYDYFFKRVERYIEKFKPTAIVCFGHRFLRQADPEGFANLQAYSKSLGACVQLKLAGKKYPVFPSIDLLDILEDEGEEGLANVLGLISRHIANGLAGELQFKVDAKAIKNAQIRFVDSIKKFDRMMEELEQAKFFSCDTETLNLNKVKNKMLTIQFCTCLDHAYILPFLHKDTPFSGKDLKYISKRLKRFFEGRNKASYMIFHNGNFDLNVIRTAVDIGFFPTKLWDTIAGEFAIDENMKFITNAPMVNYKPYSLESVALRYGFDGYGNDTILKSESKSISNKSLSEEKLRKYMVYDVLVPIAIHQQQQRIANELLKYKKYRSVVTEQIGDMIHCFSDMNFNGNPIDIDFLMFLNSPESPIVKELKAMAQKLYDTKQARKLNDLLVQEANIPAQGLFGKTTTWLFDLHKPVHKARFFFEALKLKPLKIGASGLGKVDKRFQATYAEVPEVKSFTALSKAEKLKSSYVNSLINMLKSVDDFKSDHSVRPHLGFQGVVTGRISEKDPNCQQIPSRGELGKNIKRLFIAPLGWLYIKVDYSAHEVRGLSLISGDEKLAGVFQVGLDLRKKYRRRPSKELAEDIELRGDVHKLNVEFFFGQNLRKIAKDLLKQLRDQIKGVVFGLIYGKGNRTLARDLDKPEEFVKDLVKQFFKRFAKGGKWLNDIEKFAQENHFVESPLGRRRNLFAYLLPKAHDTADYLWGAMNRRARNSPIQGMGSDFGFIGARLIIKKAWERARDLGERVLKLNNMVHDSLENLCRTDNFMFGLNTIQWALTDGVKEEVKKRHNFNFVINLEIDMEIGPNLRDCQKWDGQLVELVRIVAESLAFQKYKMKYEVPNIKKTITHMLTKQMKDAPDFLKYQMKEQGMPNVEEIVKKACEKVKASTSL